MRQQYIQSGLRKAAVYRAYARLQYSIYRAYVRQQYIYTKPTSGSSIIRGYVSQQYIYRAYVKQQYIYRAAYVRQQCIQSGLRKAAVYLYRAVYVRQQYNYTEPASGSTIQRLHQRME